MFIFPIAVLLMKIYTKYLAWNEKRNGVILPDPILPLLPTVNCSVPIAMLEIVTGIVVFTTHETWQDVELFWFKFACISYTKILTLYITPLNPPIDVIPLSDTLLDTVIFKNDKAHVKDLMFSGHTAFMVLCALEITHVTLKFWTTIAAICMAIMLLVTKNHYTIDVIISPFVVYTWFFAAQSLWENVLVFDSFLVALV